VVYNASNMDGLDQRSCSTLGTVTTWMGHCLLTGKPSQDVANHLGQLSLLSLENQPMWLRLGGDVHLCLVAVLNTV